MNKEWSELNKAMQTAITVKRLLIPSGIFSV